MTRKYFVNDAAAVAFHILHTDSHIRMKFLGITHIHYSDAKLAEQWRNEIVARLKSDGIVDYEAIEALDVIYDRMIKNNIHQPTE